MSNLRITFLGTGTSQGIPVIGSDHPVSLSNDAKDKRLRSSVKIQWGDFVYVIDCGPDFRRQMLDSDTRKLDGILFTHFHADHTAGLDDVRPYSLRYGHLDVYADASVIENLKERFAYVFATEGRYAGAPNLKITEFINEPFDLSGKRIIPVEVLHGRMKIFGFRIDNFAYITDAKRVEESEMEKLKDLDVLVVNALRIDPHPTHFNLEEALEFIGKIKPERTYLTHISQHLGFHEEVSKLLPQNVFLGYDGLSFQV
jgi:phosphoribosyl 1,2-cyclic phosphate phosphodiesterase